MGITSRRGGYFIEKKEVILMKECLQTTIGSCRGCNVLGLIETSLQTGKSADEIAKRYCPADVLPQTHLIKLPRGHGMGQSSCILRIEQ